MKAFDIQAVLDALPSPGTQQDYTTLQEAIESGLKTALSSLKQRPANPNVTKCTPSFVSPRCTSTGLEFCIAPHHDWEVQDSKCILTKHNQGTTPSDLLKHRKMVCVAIKPSFVSNSVICIMSQHEIDNHNIAMECQQWKLALAAFAKQVTGFDMLAPFQMPIKFDSSFFDNPDKVLKTTSFINIFEDWCNLEPDTVYLWQGWLNVYASAADTISMEWCEEILDLSLDKDLWGKVDDSLHEVDMDNKGAVTTYFLVT